MSAPEFTTADVALVLAAADRLRTRINVAGPHEAWLASMWQPVIDRLVDLAARIETAASIAAAPVAP